MPSCSFTTDDEVFSTSLKIFATAVLGATLAYGLYKHLPKTPKSSVCAQIPDFQGSTDPSSIVAPATHVKMSSQNDRSGETLLPAPQISLPDTRIPTETTESITSSKVNSDRRALQLSREEISESLITLSQRTASLSTNDIAVDQRRSRSRISHPTSGKLMLYAWLEGKHMAVWSLIDRSRPPNTGLNERDECDESDELALTSLETSCMNSVRDAYDGWIKTYPNATMSVVGDGKIETEKWMRKVVQSSGKLPEGMSVEVACFRKGKLGRKAYRDLLDKLYSD